MDLRTLRSLHQPPPRKLPSRLRLPLPGRMTLTALLGAALLAMLSPGKAHAEFTVCNQTLDVVNLAVGQKVDNADQTDGWWTIGANQCVNVIREELTNRYIYL